MARWLSLHGKKIILSGVFWKVPRRRLVKRIKAIGASLHPSVRTMPARMDVAVITEGYDPELIEAATARGAQVYPEDEFLEAIGWHYGMDRRLSELRGLLQGAQTPQHWWDICQLLEFWTEGVEVGVRYVKDHARAWPSELKPAPGKWLGRVAAGHREPRVEICTALCHSPGFNAGIRFEQQLRAMPHVRHINMAATSKLGANMARLQDPALEVESIYLFYPKRAYPSWGYILAHTPTHKEWTMVLLKHLRALYIDAPLDAKFREQLLTNTRFPRLETLVEYPNIPERINLGELFSGFRPPALR